MSNNNNKKPTKQQVGNHLLEALQLFCEEEPSFRDVFMKPFRQHDCIWASDCKVLVRIRPEEAGVAIGKFREMNDFDAQRVMPDLKAEDYMQARLLSRQDASDIIRQMQEYEEKKQPVLAELCGVKLTMEAMTHIESFLRICGAERARLVWHDDTKVLLQLDGEKGRTAAEILQMGSLGTGNEHIISVPTTDYAGSANAYINWQQGMEEWAAIKAEQERKAEEERMARREVYLVEVVKRAYIPVYARNADEARHLCKNNWMEPEDDGDDEWMLGDEVPEAEDLDDIPDCYQTILTRDGEVDRDEIYNLDQISEEWEKKQKKED